MQGENYDPLHFENNLSTSRASSAGAASSAARRGLNTISQCGSTSPNLSRTTSRNRRRIRFLTTALPKARGVVNPTLGPSALSVRKQNAAK